MENGYRFNDTKKMADLRPEKLRQILLMDARFNHNNKLIGKKMMEYGETHGLLAQEQYMVVEKASPLRSMRLTNEWSWIS
jgi:hypothetical protein